MTSIEASLAVGFMAMFLMALLAASAGVERLVRGYSCRVLSKDLNASGPERGCIGQSDEVSATGIASIRLANDVAFANLRDQLAALGPTTLYGSIAIDTRTPLFDLASVQERHSELEAKCLWEKLAAGSGSTFLVARNYWVIDSSPTASITMGYPLPPPGLRLPSATYWFLRSGRLLGETQSADGLSVEPASGLGLINDDWLSIDLAGVSGAISRVERDEIQAGENVIIGAPDSQWGILNQVCLFGTITSSIPNLFLLSGERGKDLGVNDSDLLGSSADSYLFGRELGVFSRQRQPRLVFYSY